MSIKKELVSACHKVYNRGFVAAYDGNLSVRLNDEHILITPSATCKGEVSEELLIVIDLDGNKVEGKGKVSTENKLHTYIYKNRPDVNAVVHCHPVFATAFASAGKSIDQPVFPEIILLMGKVPLCKYATPSTEEVTDSIAPHIKNVNAMLLENHGAVTYSSNINDAYFLMEKLEHTAKILLIASLLGGAKNIPEDKVEKLLSISESVYGIKPKW